VTSARLAEALARKVTVDELRHALDRPLTQDERDEVRALVAWFTARYATAEARLAYVRQATRKWALVSPPRSI
jgi:hypothetical protein